MYINHHNSFPLNK